VAYRDQSVSKPSRIPAVTRWIAAGLGVAASSWVAYAAIAWIRYGQPKRRIGDGESDSLLDQFMPEYEVDERHSLRVTAPAEIAFQAAATLDLEQSKVIRGLFKSREFMLSGQQSRPQLPQPLLDWAEALGWGMLAHIPGREVVMGAATKPWEAKVIFRPIPGGEFANFNEPGYVKIIWTLRADPISPTESIVRTDTRVATTDRDARAKFRLYWAFLSPGIVLIRKIALAMVKREAERFASQTLPTPSRI